MKDWRTTLGGACAAAGAALFGTTTIVATLKFEIPSAIMIGFMVAGVVLSVGGTFFHALFTPDKRNLQEPTEETK